MTGRKSCTPTRACTGSFYSLAKRLNALAAQLFPDVPPPFAGDVARMMAGPAGFLREEEGQEPLFVSDPDAQVSWVSAAWLSLSSAFHAPLAKRSRTPHR
jgi:hypothetical protein